MSTRPIPDETIPEIEKNKEFLLNKLSIGNLLASVYAKTLYVYNISELTMLEIIFHENDSYIVKVIDKSKAIYNLHLNYGYISAIYRESENGLEVIFQTFSTLQP